MNAGHPSFRSGSAPCIGVFDSGVGGLSVLVALRERLPRAPLRYVADSAFAPYGDRPPAEVIDRSTRIVQRLLDHGATLVVVACNTATALAIEVLRQRWPQVPFVGVEPGIKPAVALSRNKRIGVMATRATVASERVRGLVQRHAGEAFVHLQACPGLADAIEAGVGSLELEAVLKAPCDAMKHAKVDTVVLGCTHYPFAAQEIKRLLGDGVTLVDTAHAIAARAEALWQTSSNSDRVLPLLCLESTGDPSTLQRMGRHWLGTDVQCDRIAA
jgi:glutamate racemase